MNRLTSDEALEALDAMDVPVLIADIINGGSWVTWVNPAFTRVFGYTLEAMHDGGLADMMGDETDMVEVDRMYQEVLRGNRATVTTVGYCADGTKFWTTFTMSPVVVKGRVVRWVGIQHDVSEYIRQSEQDRRSYELERRARVGLNVVGTASDIMAEVDHPHPLRAIAELFQGRLAQWAGFFVVDDGALRAVEDIEFEPGRPRRVSGGARFTVDGVREPATDPIVRVLESPEQTRGKVLLDGSYVPGTPSADLVARLRPHRAAFPNAADEVLVVPVVGRRRTLCVLAVLPRATDLRWEDEGGEIATILELAARRIGLAIENAQLYAREHEVAETLQRAMLPEQAHIADLDVWTYYAPNAEHAQVGGDWYDVIPVSPESVGVVIGDVVGHDIEAAAFMGQLRSVVRSYACELVDPGLVLTRVDELVAGMRIPRMATLVYAALTRDRHDWDVAYSRAGHLPPILVRDGEVVLLQDAGSRLVGLGLPARETARVRVRPADVLVFYTDGLVERRHRSMRDGLRALAELCGRLSATDAAGMGEEILAHFADAPEDDVAVVVVRVPEPGRRSGADDGAPPLIQRWHLPADPQSIGRARHFVLSTCVEWGIADAGAAELVVSELVANAVMHGWGMVSLRLEAAGGVLSVEVADANPAPPRTSGDSSPRIGGYGMHIVDRLAEWGWRPSGAGKVVWARLRPSEGVRAAAAP